MKTNKLLFASKGIGRFCGEAIPLNNSYLDWLLWLVRMLLYHLPVRISIICGELANHDWHHFHQHDPDWANGIYARQRDLEAGIQGYTEAWGLFEAMDEVFECLSQIPPLPEEPKPLPSEEIAGIFNVM